MVKLGAGTLVRQQEERVSVEAEDGDSVDLVCFRSVLICVGLKCLASVFHTPCVHAPLSDIICGSWASHPRKYFRDTPRIILSLIIIIDYY